MNVTDEELLQALDRIAKTPDGQLLYRFFQRTAQRVPPAPGEGDGALRSHVERVRYALELMAIMAKGIEQSAGPDFTERHVAFTGRKSAAVSQHVAAREHLQRNDPELKRFTTEPKPGTGTGTGG